MEKDLAALSGSGSLTPGVLVLSRAIEGGKRVSPDLSRSPSFQMKPGKKKQNVKYVGKETFISARQRTARFIEGNGIIYVLSKH